jgi:hypothetical protein
MMSRRSDSLRGIHSPSRNLTFNYFTQLFLLIIAMIKNGRGPNRDDIVDIQSPMAKMLPYRD